MKPFAMVFDGPSRLLRRAKLITPTLAAGECWVRIQVCTLCGSDVHTFDGRRTTPTPTVLGHEILGTIETLPPGPPLQDVAGQILRPGDRVIWSLAVSCGDCFYCAHDLPQKCDKLFKYGHEPLTKDSSASGGLATHCHLRKGTTLLRVPDEIPDLVACPASCATATIAAAFRLMGNLRGASLLILGAGMLGLTAAAMARWSGARTVLLHDVDEKRLNLANAFGATHCLPPDANWHTLTHHIWGATEGRGVDYSLDVSGAPSAMDLSLATLRIGGVAIWVGAVLPTEPITIFPEFMVRRHLTLRGVHNYHPGDLQTALTFLGQAHRDYPFAKLVSVSFPLERADDAFHYASVVRPVRVAVVPPPQGKRA